MTTLKNSIILSLFLISFTTTHAQEECFAANGFWSDVDEEHPFLCDDIDDGKTLIIPVGITVIIDEKIDLTGVTAIIIRGTLFFDGNTSRLTMPEGSGVMIEEGGALETNVANNSQKLRIGTKTYWSSKNGNIGGPERYGEIVLPVELVSFSARVKNKRVRLEWTTATELNSDVFAIEHSKDGRSFSTIGYEDAAGTTNNMQDYSFHDESPEGGNNFYRLRQIDFDGTESFSGIKVVEFRQTDFFSLRQSSDFSRITLSFKEETSRSGEINIYDLSGRMLDQYDLSRFDREVELDISNYEIGHYVLQVNSRGEQWAKSFVKMAA